MASTLRLCTLQIVQLSKNVCKPNCRYMFLSAVRPGTIVPFKLSDIGEGIRDVIIKEWYVKLGDRVSQFDNICEVQSDKASATITSRYDGVIRAVHYKVDDVALVGNPLVDIEVEEEITNVDESVKKSVRKERNEETDSQEGHDIKVEINSNKVLTTPAVRRLAMENNINLKDVPATGKSGRVLKEDILVYMQDLSHSSSIERPSIRTNEKTVLGENMPVKKYAKAMWKSMTQSLSIPHFVYSDECNVSKLVKYRDEVKDTLKEQGISLSLMPFFIKAASRALERVPELNAWLDEDAQNIRIVKSHNISIAMDTPEGLIVPNIKNVQTLSIVAIAKELNRLQALGKIASIPLADLSEGTFSLSNIGVIGGTYTKPVILSPQIVIGALGKIQKLPRFDELEKVYPANVIAVSWAADHRVVDGVTMAKYSSIWKYYVENPMHLLLGA